jgi:hypothetical protein
MKARARRAKEGVVWAEADTPGRSPYEDTPAVSPARKARSKFAKLLLGNILNIPIVIANVSSKQVSN